MAARERNRDKQRHLVASKRNKHIRPVQESSLIFSLCKIYCFELDYWSLCLLFN